MIDDGSMPKAPSKRLMRLARMESRHLYNLRHEYTWYCLTVTPQKETLLSQQLRERGIASFIPINVRWRRKDRTTKEKYQVPFVAFPGYIFAAVKTDYFPWSRTYGLEHISGALGFAGEPQAINVETMTEFLGKFREGLEPDKVERHMRSNLEYAVGDNAEVLEGPYTGHIVEVTAIQGKKASFELELLGGKTKARIDTYSLGKVA